VKILFVRHGESQANLDRVFANRATFAADLTAAGIAQAQALARSLENAAVTHVYTSPLPRARQTAEIVATALAVPCAVDDALREYDVGDYEGAPYGGERGWRCERYERVEAAWQEGDLDARHPGGESLADLRDRFLPFLDRLAARHDASEVVVAVGHGGLYRVILPQILPGITAAFALAHPLDHGDSIVVERHGDSWRCVRWGGA
jgi:probable phosphoglycerate mutase